MINILLSMPMRSKMQSNSKLTDYQKSLRKQMLAQFAGVLATSGRVTVALERTGEKMGRFSLAIASEDERKIRRKVGEFYALNRFDDGDSQSVRLADSDMAVEGFGYDSEEDYLMARATELAIALDTP